ncbi:hypothetical protein ABEB36_002991 [Hypothenemus hampei]|uniref:Uncharacterized protein n=1 Tax=Hypothenemus hampei TaxID=57062 RepID=A0ABD1F7M7_HYPHA
MSERTSMSSVDDDQLDEKLSIKSKIRKRWQLYAKILEMIFCCLCIGFIMEPAKKGDLAKIHFAHFALIFPTFFGYLITVSIFLIAKVMDDIIQYRTCFISSLIASCLFFVCGILLALDHKRQYIFEDFLYQPKPQLLEFHAVSTAFSFFNSILFGLEAYYIWKLKEDF